MSTILDHDINTLPVSMEFTATDDVATIVVPFAFKENIDDIHLEVNAIDSAGTYTYKLTSNNVLAVTPSIPKGSVVYIYRETDVDKSLYTLNDGAVFTASNIDANFTQIRKSQQELIGRFKVLKARVDSTLSEAGTVLTEAKQATQDAKQATKDVQDAIFGKINDSVVGTWSGRSQRAKNKELISIYDINVDSKLSNLSSYESVYVPTLGAKINNDVVYLGDNLWGKGTVKTSKYMNVKSLVAHNTQYKREVVANLPHIFPDYNLAKTTLGVTSTSGAQGFYIDTVRQRIYIMYMFGKGTVSTLNNHVIAVYDFSLKYLGWNYYTMEGSCESFSVYEDKLYTVYNGNTVWVYPLSTLSLDGKLWNNDSAITLGSNATAQITVDSTGIYCPAQGSASGSFANAFPILKYDFSGKVQGYIHTNNQSVGSRNSSLITSNNTAMTMNLPKLQGIHRYKNGVVISAGSSYPSDTTHSTVHSLSLYGANGSLISKMQLNPAKVLAKYTSLGIDAINLEYEGLCVLNGTDIYSMSMTNNTSSDVGILIVREWSDTVNAVDYTDCAVDLPTLNYEALATSRLPSPNGNLINPLSGDFLTTLESVLELMVTNQLPALNIYQAQANITLPTVMQGELSSWVEIKNLSNSNFKIELTGFYNNQVFFVQYDLATNTIKTIRTNGVRTSSLKLVQRGTENPVVQVGYGENPTNLYQLVRPAMGDGYCNVSYGGQPTPNSTNLTITLHEFYARNQGDADSTSIRVLALAKDGVRAGVHNTTNLGTSGSRFAQLNVQTANIGNLSVYSDNSSAKSGGLVSGDVYRTSDGTLKIVY